MPPTKGSIPRKNYKFVSPVNLGSFVASLWEEESEEAFKESSSDITFLVDKPPVPIKAHKLVLALSSPYFKDLFYKTQSETKEDASSLNLLHEVVLPDVKASIFKQILQFIYTREIGVNEKLTFKDLPALTLAAKQFMVADLLRHCISSILKEDLFSIYEKVSKSDPVPEFANELWFIICRTAPEALSSKDFLKMSHQNLCRLLQSDDLNCNELRVYQAALKWADNQCRENKQIVDAKNRRDVLKDARMMVRFPNFTAQMFLGTVDAGFLIEKEIHQVYHYKSSGLISNLTSPLTAKQRKIDESWLPYLDNDVVYKSSPLLVKKNPTTETVVKDEFKKDEEVGVVITDVDTFDKSNGDGIPKKRRRQI